LGFRKSQNSGAAAIKFLMVAEESLMGLLKLVPDVALGFVGKAAKATCVEMLFWKNED